MKTVDNLSYYEPLESLLSHNFLSILVDIIKTRNLKDYKSKVTPEEFIWLSVINKTYYYLDRYDHELMLKKLNAIIFSIKALYIIDSKKYKVIDINKIIIDIEGLTGIPDNLLDNKYVNEIFKTYNFKLVKDMSGAKYMEIYKLNEDDSIYEFNFVT